MVSVPHRKIKGAEFWTHYNWFSAQKRNKLPMKVYVKIVVRIRLAHWVVARPSAIIPHKFQTGYGDCHGKPWVSRAQCISISDR